MSKPEILNRAHPLRTIELRAAGNGGWIVFHDWLESGRIPTPVGAFTTKADLMVFLEQLLEPPVDPIVKQENAA